MTQPQMAFYTALAFDDSERCHPMDRDYGTLVDRINGEPRAAIWRPPAMRIIRQDEGRVLVRSDSPWLGEFALIFRPAAILALGPLLREHGELLPLQCAGAELWMFNPWRLEALDEDASSVIRFDDGRVMDITRHVFRPDVIRGVDTFKIPQLRASPAYLSQRFVDAWQAAGLTGLEFEQVWSET